MLDSIIGFFVALWAVVWSLLTLIHLPTFIAVFGVLIAIKYLPSAGRLFVKFDNWMIDKYGSKEKR